MNMKKHKYTIIILTIIASVILAWAFAWPHRLSGDCMEPAAKDGQLCFLNRMLPYLRQYQINDIILFKHEEKIWISRIVALETNTIQIFEDKIVINGTTLQDVEIHRNWAGWKHGVYGIDKTLQVPQNHVFVLSDNLAAQHDDSRVFGPVAKESILGVAWLIL